MSSDIEPGFHEFGDDFIHLTPPGPGAAGAGHVLTVEVGDWSFPLTQQGHDVVFGAMAALLTERTFTPFTTLVGGESGLTLQVVASRDGVALDVYTSDDETSTGVTIPTGSVADVVASALDIAPLSDPA